MKFLKSSAAVLFATAALSSFAAPVSFEFRGNILSDRNYDTGAENVLRGLQVVGTYTIDLDNSPARPIPLYSSSTGCVRFWDGVCQSSLPDVPSMVVTWKLQIGDQSWTMQQDWAGNTHDMWTPGPSAILAAAQSHTTAPAPGTGGIQTYTYRSMLVSTTGAVGAASGDPLEIGDAQRYPTFFNFAAVTQTCELSSFLGCQNVQVVSGVSFNGEVTSWIRLPSEPSEVPEPGTLALLSAAAFGLAAARRKRRV